jgi:hypothetical protein
MIKRSLRFFKFLICLRKQTSTVTIYVEEKGLKVIFSTIKQTLNLKIKAKLASKV